MSAFTTLYLTRAKALEVLMTHLLGGLSDAELARMADGVLASRLYNVCIVADETDNDNHLV